MRTSRSTRTVMRPGRWRAFLPAIFAALLFAPAADVPADTLVLNDGSTYEGRVTERTREHVLLQVDSGGISASMRFEMKDIDSLIESPPESAQLAEQFRHKLAAAEEAGLPHVFAELGQWAHDNRLYREAVQAYQQARRLVPDHDATFGFLAARNMALANDLRSAHGLLKELAEKYPDDSQIAAELARLNEQAQRRVNQMFRLALGNYKKGEMRAAVRLMERLQQLDMDELIAKADYASVQQAQMPFGKLLADARLHQPCAACGSAAQLGLVPCPTCKATGKITKMRVEAVTEKDPKSGIERRRAYQVEHQVRCPTCGGFTTTLCPACRGAGVDLGTVGPVERLFVIEGLEKRIDFLYGKLAPYAAEPSSLTPINLEIVHLHAARLRYYMQQYVQLNRHVVGKALTTLADRRAKLANLLRHTTAAYRSRDLSDYKEALAARLKEQIRRDGILWPEDFKYQVPSEVSANTPKPAEKP